MNYALTIIALYVLVCCTGCAELDKTKSLDDAIAMTDKKDYTSALELLNKIIKKYPDFDSALVERAYVYLELENNAAGLEDADKAIDLKYLNTNGYFVRALLLMANGAYTSAIKDYTHIIDVGNTEDKQSALMLRAQLYVDINRIDEATADLDMLIEIDSLDVTALNAKATIYSRSMDIPSALDLYARSLEINPKFADTYYKRSLLYDVQFKRNEAMLDIQKAIELDNRKSPYYMSRALLYKGFEEFERAFRDFDTSIYLNPKNGYAYLNRGYMKQQLHDNEGAEEDFNKARKLGMDPNPF